MGDESNSNSFHDFFCIFDVNNGSVGQCEHFILDQLLPSIVEDLALSLNSHQLSHFFLDAGY